MKDRDNVNVMLLDDEAEIIQAVKRVLRPFKLNVHSFTDVREAELALHNLPIDIVISDQRMPYKSGIDFLAIAKDRYPASKRILLSAYQDFGEVADAFNKKIVHKYISKPWQNAEFKFVIGRILDRLTNEQNSSVVPSIERGDTFHSMVSQCKSMTDLFASVQQASTSNAPIFIHGETGTGKELVAKACHQESFFCNEPFVAFNCANFSESLMEAQLFGHTKGAYTGAQQAQQGVFAAAGKGVLFLDEITTLDLSLQAKLLRVIQEREFTPLGSMEVKSFNAQIVTASSTSLIDAVKEGTFREDLFYRLYVIGLSLPPLRERKGDVELLAKHFLQKHKSPSNEAKKTLSPDAMALLSQYDWPGNVRQLENIIHGLVVMQQSAVIAAADVNAVLNQFNSTINTERKAANILSANDDIKPLWLIEKHAIQAAIDSCNGNVVLAAAKLEVSPSTLYRKMQNWA